MARKPLVVDILTRVSRTMGREGDSYGSPETQLKECEGWIERKGYARGEHFHEENVSGGALLARRPGLQAVVRNMQEGRSDAVVVRGIDRFMRSVALSAQAIELIEGTEGEPGIGRIFSVSEDFNLRTRQGRFVFNTLQAAAEYQRETAKDEWRVNRTRAWERGVWMARTPLGYARFTEAELRGLLLRPTRGRGTSRHIEDPNGLRWLARTLEQAGPGALIEHPIHGQAMREAFMLRGEDKRSWGDISDYLEHETGLPQNPDAQAKRFGSRVYLGEYSLVRHVRDKETGRVIETKVIHTRPNNHAALTTAKTFRKVQKSLVAAKRTAGMRTGSMTAERWWLVGWVRCAGCRHFMRADQNQSGFRTYTCRKRFTHGNCPAPAYAAADALEDYIARAVHAIDEQATITEVDTGEDLATLLAHVEAAEAYGTRIALAAAAAGVEDAMSDDLADAKAAVEEARDALAAAEARQTVRLGSRRNLGDLLGDGTLDERRSVIGAYIDRVVLRRGREPLQDRVLLLLHGQEHQFEPLPRRGKALPIESFPWPA